MFYNIIFFVFKKRMNFLIMSLLYNIFFRFISKNSAFNFIFIKYIFFPYSILFDNIIFFLLLIFKYKNSKFFINGIRNNSISNNNRNLNNSIYFSLEKIKFYSS